MSLFCLNKIRAIRAIAAQIIGTMVVAITEWKPTSESSEKSRQVRKFTYDLYHKILKERLKEVDVNIRQKLVQSLTSILGAMSREFLTVGELEDVFLGLMRDKLPEDRRIAL